jgi:hypothetical protein
MVAVTVPEEDRFRTHVHEVLRQDRGAALVDRRGRQLRTVDVAVEQEDASGGCDDVRGVRRPGEDDLVLGDAPVLVHVLDTEELLPGADQRSVRATVAIAIPVMIVVTGDGGERGNAQQPRENRGHRSSVVHDDELLCLRRSVRCRLGDPRVKPQPVRAACFPQALLLARRGLTWILDPK